MVVSSLVSDQEGDVAQMVERSLSMREARGSIPRFSIASYMIHAPSTLMNACSLSLEDSTVTC